MIPGLPTLGAPGEAVSTRDLRGQVWVLNVWASWCVACRLEHPVVKDLAGAAGVPLYGAVAGRPAGVCPMPVMQT